jgi:hypothetical protein
MKKAFYVLTLDTHIQPVCWYGSNNRLFHIEECDTKTLAKEVIAKAKKYDKFKTYRHFKYVIIECLIITQEKIKSIIDNSNVE